MKKKLKTGNGKLRKIGSKALRITSFLTAVKLNKIVLKGILYVKFSLTQTPANLII